MRERREGLSGWLYVVKGLEVLSGFLILTRRFRALGLALIGPVVVNIFLFHVFLDRGNLAPGVVLLALWSFLVWRRRRRVGALCAAES